MKDFSLTVLGSSSATPHSSRFPSAQIFYALGNYFLLDCGEGTQIQLRRARVPFEHIRTIFISHLHGDHFYGIFGLLASFNLMGRKTPLVIYAPKGLECMIHSVFNSGEQVLGFSIFFKELPHEPFACIEEKKNYRIYAITLSHRIDCWGFYFVEKEKERNVCKSAIQKYNLTIDEIRSVKLGNDIHRADGTVIMNQAVTVAPKPSFSYAYIADTIYKPEIAEYIKNVSLLFHEATFCDDRVDLALGTYHSTARQAAECAKLANAKKLIIGHFSARYKKLDGHLQEAQTVFPSVELASDLYNYSVDCERQLIWGGASESN